jgi:flavin reductase (DIM6/NTAB) family NADH-FMN oxidoreductase RutF
MEIPVTQLSDNIFRAIGDDWMLITAGTKDHFNTMTASWGACGVLWSLPVAICFIRPQRYTFKFMEKYDYFTLSFLGEEHREILQFCGSFSGREVNKIARTGLIPLITKTGNVYFEQARLVLECKKMYADRINSGRFIMPEIRDSVYPGRDYHKFYIGEIISCLLKD